MPDSWLKFYEYELSYRIENVIPLTVKVGINNIRSIYITDTNTEKNICGKKQQRSIFSLSFKKPQKHHKVTHGLTNLVSMGSTLNSN